MPAPTTPGSAPTQQQVQGAKTAAALGYLASLPPATHLFQPAASQVGDIPSPDTGGNNGGSTRTTLSPGIDWASSFFSSLGLPSDVVSKVNTLFSTYSDVNDASAAAISYIRGTPWYAQTFPGINTGIQKGLFSDEQGYRDYVNKLNVISHQYQGRAISADETTSYIQQGLAPAYVDNLFQAGAYVKANSPEIQYDISNFGDAGQGPLSQSELSALGKQQVGLTNDLGASLQAKLQKAAQRMQTIFQGKLATPGLSLGPQGVYSPLLAGTKQANANNNPDIPS